MWLMKLFRRKKLFKIQEPVSRSTGTTGPPGTPQDGCETCIFVWAGDACTIRYAHRITKVFCSGLWAIMRDLLYENNTA